MISFSCSPDPGNGFICVSFGLSFQLHSFFVALLRTLRHTGIVRFSCKKLQRSSVTVFNRLFVHSGCFLKVPGNPQTFLVKSAKVQKCLNTSFFSCHPVVLCSHGKVCFHSPAVFITAAQISQCWAITLIRSLFMPFINLTFVFPDTSSVSITTGYFKLSLRMSLLCRLHKPLESFLRIYVFRPSCPHTIPHANLRIGMTLFCCFFVPVLFFISFWFDTNPHFVHISELRLNLCTSVFCSLYVPVKITF